MSNPSWSASAPPSKDRPVERRVVSKRMLTTGGSAGAGDLTVNDVVATGDTVVGRWTASGTHGGPLGDIPATGKPITITGINIIRFEDGKMVEEWENFDELAMLQQIGVVPT